MAKYNAEQVNSVFSLMFETFWTTPYDRRRGNPLLSDFERRARRAAVLLGSAEFTSVSGERLSELTSAVVELEQSVRRIAQAGLFPRKVCIEALERIRGIRDSLPAECAV